MATRDDDFQDGKDSKSMKSILTASGKKESKNRRISWGGYNKHHIFSREGHVRDEDVPMHENLMAQFQFIEEETSGTDFSQMMNLIANKENNPNSNNINLPNHQQKEKNDPKAIDDGLSFYSQIPLIGLQLPPKNPQSFVENFPQTPNDTPVKFKVSDTPLLKSLDSSVFVTENDSSFDETGNIKLSQREQLFENLGLESSFMKDLIARADNKLQGVNKDDSQNKQDKNHDQEIQNAVPQPEDKQPPIQFTEEEDSSFPHELVPVQKEQKPNNRLSLSIKNIIDTKSPEEKSYLPPGNLEDFSELDIFKKLGEPPQGRMEEETQGKALDFDFKNKNDIGRDPLVVRLFASENDNNQSNDTGETKIDFAQEITEEVKKNRRLSTTVHEILHVDHPPSTIKKVEQSNFSVEHDDFIDHIMREKPLHNIFQENAPTVPLTTTALLNQSFEDKLNNFTSPQKTNVVKPHVHLSKSPLLSSPHYDFENPKHKDADSIPDSDTNALLKRRLSMKMNISDSNSFMEDEGEDAGRSTLRTDSNVLQVTEQESNEEPKLNLQTPKYPYESELKTIPECSDSFGESDAKKSSLDNNGNSIPDLNEPSGRNSIHPLLEDPNRRISLHFGLDEDELEDSDDKDEGKLPFEFEPVKKKVVDTKIIKEKLPEGKEIIINEGKQSKEKGDIQKISFNNKIKSEEKDTFEQKKPQSFKFEEKKLRSPCLKRKDRQSFDEGEIVELKVNKQMKLNSMDNTGNNAKNSQTTQGAKKKSPFKVKGVLKNGKKSENIVSPDELKEEKLSQEAPKAVQVILSKETSIPCSPVGKLSKEKIGNKMIEESSSQSSRLSDLIAKSPRLNRLQKRFLIDFMSPKENALNQSVDVNPAYSMLEKAPLFHNDKIAESETNEQEEQNSFEDVLKRKMLLKCKACYEYAQKVKLLKEQLHDLESNIEMLDSELKNSEVELKQKNAEFSAQGVNQPTDYSEALNYDSSKFALVQNLQITLTLFGFLIKTSIFTETYVKYRIKFDNEILGIIGFGIKEENEEGATLMLNEFTLIDTDSGYRKSSRGSKILGGEETIFQKTESKIDLKNVFNKRNIIDIVFNEIMTCFFKKNMTKASSLFIFTSFRIRSYLYLLNTIKFLSTSQILEKIILNYDTLHMKAIFKFKRVTRNIGFSLNLKKLWWNDFEVLWEGDGSNQNLIETQDAKSVRLSRHGEKTKWDAVKIKLMTKYNSGINKRTLTKFENVVTEILSYKWISF